MHRREEDRGSGSLQNCTTRRPRRSDSPPQLETIASGVPQRDTAKALRGRNGTSDEGLPTSLPLPDAGRNTNREDRTADDARGEEQWTKTASVRHCAQMNTRRHIITTTANDLWRPRRSGLRESGGAGRRVSNRPPVSGGRAKKRKPHSPLKAVLLNPLFARSVRLVVGSSSPRLQFLAFWNSWFKPLRHLAL